MARKRNLHKPATIRITVDLELPLYNQLPWLQKAYFVASHADIVRVGLRYLEAIRRLPKARRAEILTEVMDMEDTTPAG